MGSFFIPMMVMLYVYVKISCVVAQRHDQLAHIETIHTRVSEFKTKRFYVNSFIIAEEHKIITKQQRGVGC